MVRERTIQGISSQGENKISVRPIFAYEKIITKLLKVYIIE